MTLKRSTPALSFQSPSVRARLRKLALIGGALLVFCYVAGVTSGYLWLRHGRGAEQVRILDIALFRLEAVRETLGRQHFVRAREQAAAKNYQAAYISYVSGLRQAPDDIAGRLDAAAFFRSVGAANQSLAVLEEGLARHAQNLALIDATFEYLLESGRSGYALEKIERIYGREPASEHARALLVYQVRATLATQGAAAAGALLGQHAELKDYAPVAPVRARVLWESAERLRAIELLARHVGSPEAGLGDFVVLATWQQQGGMAEEAVRTAQLARERFPTKPAAHVLLVEAKAALTPTDGPALSDIKAYLQHFEGQPEAVATLAAVGARRGWVSLVRMLYDFSALENADLGQLALHYADALARNSRYAEFRAVLAQLETQTAEGGSNAFLLQLRLRQVVAAGALRDSDGVREYSRRLAALVRHEPHRLESFRQYFSKSGLKEAAEELSPAPAARPAVTAARAVRT